MKSKVYLSGILHNGDCPFMDCTETVICENWIASSPTWFQKATHVCSCEWTRRAKTIR